jgi:hypothetical protein
MKMFRIIEEIYYDHNHNEHIRYFVQEWKKNWLGKKKWCYWKAWNYDIKEKRVFESQLKAKDMIERYVKENPHKIVVEELVY